MRDREMEFLARGEGWEIEVTFIKETEKGILLEYEGEEAWFPKSQVEMLDEPDEEGDTIRVKIPEWLLSKEGWL